MSDLPASPGLQNLPTDLQADYSMLLTQHRAEIAPIDGITSVHSVLVERFTFTYCLLRHMERTDPIELDMQRYNQLMSLWLKVGSDLIQSYQKIYDGGAAIELLVHKISEILGEEIRDVGLLQRVRSRIVAAANE